MSILKQASTFFPKKMPALTNSLRCCTHLFRLEEVYQKQGKGMAGQRAFFLSVQPAEAGPVAETDAEDADPRVQGGVVPQQTRCLDGVPVVH